MCGICGIVGCAAETSAVLAMNAALTHRGPDESGTFTEHGVALAMSRLSILDVEGGHQPIFNETEDVVAIHNGEIYNFASLRDHLRTKGHQFRSTTDSEVLVHAYETWDHDLFWRLEGMFASCIWDRGRRRLLIGRDRFGEKPLFYHHASDGSLSFSSEIKSLLTHGTVPRDADPAALGHFLRLGFVPEPATAFKHVRVLPAGHYLVWEDGSLTIQPYARVTYRVDPRFEDDHEAEAACVAALEAAVKRQMVSDVPLGAFLSGGIDSSSVVAAMQRVATQPVRTFTVRFEDRGYDESQLARKTAEHLGTEHNEIVVPNAAFSSDDLWRIVDHVGQPFYDSSAIPTFLLCREVRNHVTVALTGDGGDEMFAGYPFFNWGLALRHLGRLPHALLDLGAAVSSSLAHLPQLAGQSFLRRVRRAMDAANGPPESLPVRILSIFDDPELASLLSREDMVHAACRDFSPFIELPEEAAGWSELRRLMYYRLRNNLTGDMLTKIDRMSMACSLELRAPMLDLEVARFASRLPDRQLIRDGKGKHILRRAMRPFLPAEVFETPKSGFSIPLHRFWNEEFHQLAARVLRADGPLEGILEPGRVAAMRQQAQAVQADSAQQSVYRASHQFWSVVMLGAWAERFEVTF